jgi:hypothetical protein
MPQNRPARLVADQFLKGKCLTLQARQQGHQQLRGTTDGAGQAPHKLAQCRTGFLHPGRHGVCAVQQAGQIYTVRQPVERFSAHATGNQDFQLLTGSSIVAVHGMGAHPDDTWCKKVDGHDGPAYVNWLKDERFLPAIVPRARIMRYGYSSQWFGKDAIKTKTSDISQAFLLDLDEFREVSPSFRIRE